MQSKRPLDVWSGENKSAEGLPEARAAVPVYSTADSRRDGRVAEGGGLLNRYRVKSSIGGSNPPLSATESFSRQFWNFSASKPPHLAA